MSETWKEHCPVDEESRLEKRQAWKGGWMHRMEDGPELGLNVASEMLGDIGNLSVWIDGYTDACKHLGDERVEMNEWR